jgi:DNA-binding NtrC family response regulator
MQTTQCRILIVDDDSSVRQLVETILSAKGYLCETACDGAEALNRAVTGSFDAVITDVVMPHMDGITLTRKLLNWNPLIPIMVMTGYLDSKFADDAVDAGASDFISKPFNVEELSLRVQRMLRDNSIIRNMKDSEKHTG